MVTLQELRDYMRITTADEEETRMLTSTEAAAEKLVLEAARIDSTTENGQTTISEYSELLKTAIKYATAYLYEHREQADHNALVKDLRSILFPVREAKF